MSPGVGREDEPESFAPLLAESGVISPIAPSSPSASEPSSSSSSSSPVPRRRRSYRGLNVVLLAETHARLREVAQASGMPDAQFFSASLLMGARLLAEDLGMSWAVGGGAAGTRDSGKRPAAVSFGGGGDLSSSVQSFP